MTYLLPKSSTDNLKKSISKGSLHKCGFEFQCGTKLTFHSCFQHEFTRQNRIGGLNKTRIPGSVLLVVRFIPECNLNPCLHDCGFDIAFQIERFDLE